jgi:hypothetical protein
MKHIATYFENKMGKVKNIAKAAKDRVVRVGKGLKKAYKIGTAAAKLRNRVSNPINQQKVVRKAIAGKGVTLPGSKYIGPGNPMNRGKPIDEADANAYQHDVDYDNYLKAGVPARKVYTGWSDADERLLKKTKADTPNGLAVNLGMGAKKGLHKLGLTSRIRDEDVYGK